MLEIVSNIQMTARYAHASADWVKQAIVAIAKTSGHKLVTSGKVACGGSGGK